MLNVALIYVVALTKWYDLSDENCMEEMVMVVVVVCISYSPMHVTSLTYLILHYPHSALGLCSEQVQHRGK
jgi:hypothetical protein